MIIIRSLTIIETRITTRIKITAITEITTGNRTTPDKKCSSDNDSNNSYNSYYINEFGDKVYKKTRTDYRKPRVNSFATGVKDHKHRNNWTEYKGGKDPYR